MLDPNTGTTSNIRQETATILRFWVVDGTTYVRLRRASGVLTDLSLNPVLAQSILQRYGYHETQNFISVQPLMGQRVQYTETRCGMVSELKPFDN